MKHLKLIRKYLLGNIENYKKALENAKAARDKAPSAMESASDETRSRMEAQIEMLNDKIGQEQQLLDLIPKTVKGKKKVKTWDLVKIQRDGNEELVVIVPAGLGGKKVDNFLLVSKDSPYGKEALGKTTGNEFKFNTSTIKVTSIN